MYYIYTGYYTYYRYDGILHFWSNTFISDGQKYRYFGYDIDIVKVLNLRYRDTISKKSERYRYTTVYRCQTLTFIDIILFPIVPLVKIFMAIMRCWLITFIT